MVGKHNCKHPQDPRNKKAGEVGACKAEYPWIGGTVDILGMENISCADPDKAEQAFHKVLYHSGASTVTENAEDPKDALTNEFRHHVRSYATGGTSGHHNGHSEQSSFNSSSSSVHPNKGTQVSGTNYTAVGGSDIKAARGGIVNDCTGGETCMISDGDLYNEYVGNISNNTEGNKVDTICGDKCTIVSKGSNDTSGSGQCLLNVQDGNMDTQIDQGKYRVKAGNDITIDSTTKITIVVGSSSIVLEPSKITIKSPAVEFIKG